MPEDTQEYSSKQGWTKTRDGSMSGCWRLSLRFSSKDKETAHMGRKGSWFSAVKKVFVSDTKKDQKHHHHKSKLACFGIHHQYYEDLDMAPEGAPIAIVPSLPPRKDIKQISEAEDEQGNFSLVMATTVAAGAAVAEVARLSNTPRCKGKMNEEMAAIYIQTAYRGYVARRSLRGLRGLARLKALVQGQSVQRQAATTLQCMQTISHLQSQIRARKMRISEENRALQRQLQQKREKELDKLQANQFGEKWDLSAQSKEQVEAKLLNRQVAAMRREKALAYASTHQVNQDLLIWITNYLVQQQTWKNNSKSAANATFMDPNNPHWGWNWLERWMAARPWEGQNITCHNSHAPVKVVSKHTMSIGEITKLYSLRDQNNDAKNSPTSPKPSHPLKASTTTIAPSSSRGSGSWGGDGDSKSMLSKISENNRRHSIGVARDDESHANSPTAFPSTKVAKAKSPTKVQSASVGVQINGTPEKAASATPKKRLSFPAIPAGARRYSLSNKSANAASNKNVAIATIPDEKVKVRNGLSSIDLEN
ncbi:Protein IQ-DOMAIN 1, partial [Mucuna pruriens]